MLFLQSIGAVGVWRIYGPSTAVFRLINFFLLSLPIFAVIGVGWAATRTRLVAQGALDALNAFSFRFALPALLLRLIAGQPLRQSFNPQFYTGYLASGAIIFVLVLGTSRIVAARDLSTAGASGLRK